MGMGMVMHMHMHMHARVVPQVGGVERDRGPLLVLPVGDALQEPFWPQGLGINRGILNAQDACWAAHQFQPDDPASWKDLLMQRNWLHANVTTPMSAMPRPRLKSRDWPWLIG